MPDDPFVHPLSVRYLEVDGQGVVFNMWYLAYFDDALTAFLAARGLPYRTLTDAGYDLQLVHTELDWRAGLGWQDEAGVGVTVIRIGRRSFTVEFTVRRAEQLVCTGRTVYAVVGTDRSGARAVPELLRAALGGGSVV